MHSIPNAEMLAKVGLVQSCVSLVSRYAHLQTPSDALQVPRFCGRDLFESCLFWQMFLVLFLSYGLEPFVKKLLVSERFLFM